MASPAEKALGTFELLEMIVFNLHPRDILLSQRVSTKWQAVISRSSKIQTVLFFKPILIDDQSPMWIYQCLDPQHPKTERCGTPMINDNNIGESTTVFKNPLIDPLLKSLASFRPSDIDSLIDLLPCAWQNSNASWRRMMVTQPRTPSPLKWSKPKTWAELMLPSGSALSQIISVSEPPPRKREFTESQQDSNQLGALMAKLEMEIKQQKPKRVNVNIYEPSHMKKLEYNEQLWTIRVEKHYDMSGVAETEDVGDR